MRKNGLKIKTFSLRRKNDSGIILISVLWVVIILSVLGMSVGRATSVEITLTRHSIEKLKSYWLARAGIIYAIQLIKEDSEDEKTKLFDSLEQCGINIDAGKKAEDILKLYKK